MVVLTPNKTKAAPIDIRPWREQVLSLGLSDEVIDFAKMRGGSNNASVEYPCEFPPQIDDQGHVTYPVIWRARTLPDTLKVSPKTQRFYNPDDTEMPLFYTPNYAALRKAIAAADGELNLMEGDRDPLCAITAGLENTAGLLSASSPVDERLAVQLQALGVKHVRYFPDKDHAGWNQAEKIQTVLTKYNIRVTVYSLPYFTAGYVIKDVADLWLALQQSSGVFTRHLSALKVMVLPDQKQKDSAKDIFKTELYDEIEARLEKQEVGSTGWTELQHCLAEKHEHDEEHPAFSWSRKYKIARCFKCDQTWLAKDVAVMMGINWRQYLNSPSERDAAQVAQQGSAIETRPRQEQTINRRVEVITDFTTLDDTEFMYGLDDAVEGYWKRLSGVQSSLFPPIENPITPLHKLGGLARVLTRPTMVGILGKSGGFKTSLLTWVQSSFSMNNAHGIVFSPEWNASRNADRIVQQAGGLKMYEMSLYERYMYEESMIQQGKMEPDDPARFGVKPTDERLLATRKALRTIAKKFRGKVVYVDKFKAHVEDIKAMITEAAHRMIDNGTPPSYMIIDYAQMIQAPYAYRSWWSIQDTITELKELNNNLGLACFVASQVTKAATTATEDDDILTSTAGLNIREDQFNLFITINPQKGAPILKPDPNGTKVDKEGRKCREMREIKLAVVKNSDGMKAETKETAIPVFADLNRMMILAEGKKTKAIEPLFEIDHDDPDINDDPNSDDY